MGCKFKLAFVISALSGNGKFSHSGNGNTVKNLNGSEFGNTSKTDKAVKAVRIYWFKIKRCYCFTVLLLHP